MRHFLSNHTSIQKYRFTGNEANKVFNYSLPRASRGAENASGILKARWRVFRSSFEVQPEMVYNIVVTCSCVQNMLFQTHNFDPDYTYKDDRHSALQNTETVRHNHIQRAFQVREHFKDYFNSAAESVTCKTDVIEGEIIKQVSIATQ
jgi:hypothetical protein